MGILTTQKGASLAAPEQQSNRIMSLRGGVVVVVVGTFVSSYADLAFLSIVGPKTIFPSADRAIHSIQLQMKAQVKAFRSKYGKMVRSLVGDGQFDSDVLEAYRQRWILPRRQLARTTIELAMKQGDLRPDLDVDTVIDTLYAPIYYRLMFETGPISDAYADGLYQSVIKGYGTSKHPKSKR